jgi:hypothetical protein
MKQTYPIDLEFYEEVVGKETFRRAGMTRQHIAAFERGDALVYEGGEISFLHFDNRESEHSGITPGLDAALARYQGRTLPVSSWSVDYLEDEEEEEQEEESNLFNEQAEERAVVVERRPPLREQEEREVVIPKKPEEERMILGKDALKNDVTITMVQFEMAVKLRKSGMSKGYRDLMPIFDLSEHHAKELNKRILKALGQEDDARESE